MAHTRTGKSVLAYYIYSFHFIIHRQDNIFERWGFPLFRTWFPSNLPFFFSFTIWTGENRERLSWRGLQTLRTSQGIEVERGALVDINWACKDFFFFFKAAVFVFIILYIFFKSKNSFLDGKKVFFFFLPRLLALWSFFFSVRDALFRVAIFRQLEWGFFLFFFSDFLPCERFPPQKRRTHRIRSIWNRAHSSRIVMT